MSVLVLLLLALSVAVNIWFWSNVLRPLRKLSLQTSKIAEGDLSALQQPCGGVAEIGDLRRTLSSMAAHVQRAQAEGLSYRHALTEGQEAERARIAHELHDDTVQSLVAIAQSIELSLYLLEKNPVNAKSMLSTARQQAVDTVDSLRRLIADLRPPALEELGIVAALKMLAQNEDDSQVEVTVSGIERRIGEPQELALFRVAQESVRNAQRHAQSRHIKLDLTFQPQEIRLLVSDDGVGFRLPETLDWLAREDHFGLIGMQERVQQLNGTLQVRSKHNQGTEISVVLPLETVPQPTETVRDPVCGAIIQPHQAYGSLSYNGKRYYFCCPVCQGAFQRNPLTYISKNTTPT